MPTKSAFPVLGAPVSPAWEHDSRRAEGLALPTPVETGKLGLYKACICANVG
jgi:hypothetical protein